MLFFISLIAPIVITQAALSYSSNPLELIQKGQQLYQSQQFSEAVKIWQQAADLFREQGDVLNQSMSLSNVSLSYQQLGEWEEAKTAIAQSLSLLDNQEKTTVQQGILAASLDIDGQLKLALGQPQNALETWQKAASIYQKNSHQTQVIQSQINQAQAMQQLGFYPRACQTLLDALNINSQDCQISEEKLQLIPQENTAISLQILGLRSLGNVLRVTGQTKQSQKVLLKSFQLAQPQKDPEILATLALSLGNTAQILGNQTPARNPQPRTIELRSEISCIPSSTYQTREQFYQQAIACYRQAQIGSSSLTKIQAQLNLLSLLIQQQQGKEIPLLINQIEDRLTVLPSSQKTILIKLKFVQQLMCLQNSFQASFNQLTPPILQSCSIVKPGFKSYLTQEQITSWLTIQNLLETTLNQAKNIEHNPSQANVLGYLGASYQLMGNLTKAQELTELALQKVSGFNYPEIAYLWQWQLGRLYQLQGENTKAIAAYRLTVDILESLRQDLVVTNTDLQFDFRDSVEPVYRELVAQLLQPSSNQPENPEKISQENLKKARDLIESLQLAELNNFFREACIEAQPQQIEQIDPHAAVIYSIVLPERLAVILSVPNQPLSYHETTLNKQFNQTSSREIEEVFDEMFANLNPFIPSPDPLRPHQQFYNWLIRPLETELKENNIKTLVFVLDGLLRGVPMAALHDGKEYLIEKYRIALTPGLQLLSPRSLSQEKLKILAGGLAEARQGFSALPGVTQEVKDISEILPAEILLNQEFTRPRLQTKIESTSFPIVHLATHGQFSSQVEETFLLTWDERINVKNLDQLLREREEKQQTPIEMLILSACQTATGDKRAVLGLAGVAVRSGARSTIATLWSVQDQSTANLMAEFYKILNQPGITKAEALRQAQLSLLHSGEYHHAFYWAPFVLVGNWL
ncbi:CHAT domain-containing protein [Rippkaea orientalis]|uniref:CHAT domain-containing protein n=1 Tax=Rippkaea orientalis TaxID=2546366 RepID=UPI001F4C3E12|nr:CHAT domain-containing protein [Rippkaea orientalis]